MNVLEPIKRLLKNQFGDTIIEVLLAISVLSVVLGVSYSLSSRAFRTLQMSRDQIQAVLILQEQAEGFRALRDEMSFADFQSATEGINRLVLPCETSSNPCQAAGGSVEWRIVNSSGQYPLNPLYKIASKVVFSDTDSNGSPDTTTITTAASWPKIGGGDENRTLVTKLRDLK